MSSENCSEADAQVEHNSFKEIADHLVMVHTWKCAQAPGDPKDDACYALRHRPGCLADGVPRHRRREGGQRLQVT
eukprot:3091706-Alexandrium_andersonii.AAC.1